ncbi:MAG: hypothetical protein L3J83_03230 [Proteobacteria bacterium]|nr:hypothetical protein [Pseudomonadota bacterium]
MNDKQKQIKKELGDYFSRARKQKCPASMQNSLYDKIGLSPKPFSWFSPRLAIAGLSLVFVSSFVVKITHQTTQDNQIQQNEIETAQAELHIAMHYINQVSMKSLSAVTTNGIKPAIIKPMARTYASL